MMDAERFGEAVVADFALTHTEEVLFELLLDAMKSYGNADERILVEGEVVRDRFDQLKPSPWLAVRRESRSFIVDALDRLQFGSDDGPLQIKHYAEASG